MNKTSFCDYKELRAFVMFSILLISLPHLFTFDNYVVQILRKKYHVYLNVNCQTNNDCAFNTHS